MTSLLSSKQKALSRKRGSALIIAVIFTIIVSFGVAALLPMMVTEWKNTSRTSAQEAAFTMAESGVDEAIWAIKELGFTATASNTVEHIWNTAGWTLSDDDKYFYREWSLAEISSGLSEEYNLDEGRIGSYRVIVENPTTSTVTILSQGTVAGGANVASNLEVSRVIEVQVKKPNPFEYGLVSVLTLDFNGQPNFDSYDSSIFTITYGDEALVGSLSEILNDLGLGNSHIWGDLLTGAFYDALSNAEGSADVSGDVIWEFEMDLPIIPRPDTTGYTEIP